MLSFRALLVHQTTDNSLMSGSLMTSGLSLGACCLAGTEVALVSWCVLLVVSVLPVITKKESSARWTMRRAIQHRLSVLMAALFSLLVVTVVAVSLVAGWQSAFTEGVSLSRLGDLTAWIGQTLSITSQPRVTLGTVLPTFGAWLGFALLGAVQVARGRMKFLDGAGRRGLWFWAGWSAVATISVWVTWPAAQADRTSSSACVGFFLLPMLLLAASGLEAVLRREFALGWVVAATLVTIGVVFAPTWMNWRSTLPTGSWFVAMTLLGGLVFGGGWLALRRVASSESLRRIALFSCVTILVLMDVAAGILSRPPLADDERELLAFRRQLMTETPPRECWLLSEESSPARLQFLLRSLWHDVALREASDWESLVATSRQTASTKPPMSKSNVSPIDTSTTRAIVVTWGNPKLPASELKRRGESLLNQATTPHYLQGRPLKGYRWVVRAEGLSSR